MNYKYKVKNIKNIDKELCKIMKYCKKSGKLKLLNNFIKRKGSKDGYRNICKNCKDPIKKSHKLICEVCEETFYSTRKNQKFCSRKCMGIHNRGINNPMYGRCGESNPFYGKHHSEETKQKISESKQGKNYGRCGENAPMYGKHHSEETKQKLSEATKGNNNPNWKDKTIYYNCEYCGAEKSINKHCYETREHHFCSNECHNKWMKENGVFKGENNPRYNPNLTQEERELGRNIDGYVEWRNEVFKRDNWTCQCCGAKGDINAHHINSYNWDKEHRVDIDNGVTLCEECHKEFHKLYGYGYNTKEQYEEFIKNKI